jgi:hypothetical protein
MWPPESGRPHASRRAREFEFAETPVQALLSMRAE